MASQSAWLSVSVKKGLRVVHRSRIIQCEWENSFGDVLMKTLNCADEATRVMKIEISQTDQFLSTHEVCFNTDVIKA